MRTCPNCKSENQDGTRFCTKCGAPLEGAAEANDQRPVKKSFPAGKILLAVALILAVVFIINTIIVAANPAMRLLNGLERLGKKNAFTVTSTVSAKYKGDDDDLKAINNASIKTSLAVNLDKMFMEVSGSILYDNKSIADIAAGVGEKELYIDLKNLYDKKFIYKLDRDVRDVISEMQVLLKYIRQANIKYDKKKYAKAIADVLDDEIRGSVGKVTVTLDGESLMEIFAEVFDVMADDEVLMKSFRENARDLINRILKDKHEFEILFSEDDLEELLDYIEDEDDFETAWMYVIEEASYGIEYALDDLDYYLSLDDMPEFDITFSFGMFSNNIKGIQVSMKVEDGYDESITVNIDSRISNKASFTKINSKNAIDIEELEEDPYEFLDIAEEIIENLVGNIEKNKKLTNAIEDLTGLDADELADLIMDELFW
ncbi:MAG: zinc-ribbon domain-containing protein [Clostridiaceae bacterium]|jgi:hypothetical protein|nr:zinc-ribbon domain-containing protein [Clostridiaceae bacterium]